MAFNITPRARLRKDKGFTLVEMLVAMLILVLLSLMLAAGLPAALKSMQASRLVSESEVLSASLNTALSDVLRYSTVEKAAGGTLLLTNESYYGSDATDLRDAYLLVDKQIFIEEKTDTAKGNQACETKLVSTGTYTDFIIKDFKIDYNAATYMFSGSYTIQAKDDKSFTKKVTFSYKSLVSV